MRRILLLVPSLLQAGRISYSTAFKFLFSLTFQFKLETEIMVIGIRTSEKSIKKMDDKMIGKYCLWWVLGNSSFWC